MFDADWAGVLRTLIVGTLTYFALVFALRISGKRTLSKMNAFDFVVTVALGSTLATTLLSKDVSLVNGIVALGLLVALQFAITWLSVRSGRVASLVKNDPALLVYEGRFLEEVMRRERVTKAEIEQALRSQGVSGPTEVTGVVLETSGEFSVLQSADNPDALRHLNDGSDRNRQIR